MQINKLYQDLACTDLTAIKNKQLEREKRDLQVLNFGNISFNSDLLFYYYNF